MSIRLLPLLLLLLTACSYTKSIGTVGHKRFTKVQLGSLTAPGQTLLVVEDTNTHEITLLSPMGGNGVVPALLQAGGIAGGALALGHVLKDNDSDTRIQNDASVHNNIVDEAPVPPIYPPKPPKTGPPENRPPKWPGKH